MRTVGLISFPKSGNTWVRRILGAATGVGESGVLDLHQQGIEAAPVALGLRLYKLHAGRHPNYLPAYTFRSDHVIHVRRHPLDVFCSYVNYISDAVRGRAPVPFADVAAIRGTDLLDIYLDAFLLHGQIDDLHFAGRTHGYYDHNRFWLAEAAKGQVTCLRYEDLHADMPRVLAQISTATGLAVARLEAAAAEVAATTQTDGKFFWRRQVGSHRDVLTPEQIARFWAYRAEDVAPLGYGPG